MEGIALTANKIAYKPPNEDKGEDLEGKLQSGIFMEASIMTKVPSTNSSYELSYRMGYGRKDIKWKEESQTEEFKSRNVSFQYNFCYQKQELIVDIECQLTGSTHAKRSFNQPSTLLKVSVAFDILESLRNSEPVLPSRVI
mmetsp:Transcript_24216/g.23796  ORF Transcript_24216/g.23796 Transcript_24216/m.23796 type:complete len:141 (+) Transcript_24216:62-484(+)